LTLPMPRVRAMRRSSYAGHWSLLVGVRFRQPMPSVEALGAHEAILHRITRLRRDNPMFGHKSFDRLHGIRTLRVVVRDDVEQCVETRRSIERGQTFERDTFGSVKQAI